MGGVIGGSGDPAQSQGQISLWIESEPAAFLHEGEEDGGGLPGIFGSDEEPVFLS